LRAAALCILLMTVPRFAMADPPSHPSEKSALLVYGEGFVFGVNEPIRWQGDTSKAAKYHVNIVVFPSDRQSRKADVTIRVRLNQKVDEDTAGDLEYDMSGYKKEYPGVQFDELAVAHPSYAVFPKLFFVPAMFYEYVVYLNPGTGVPFTLSATLSVQGRPASVSELADFRSVVASLRLLKPAAAG
jgi:hypothetical protein